MSDDNNIDYFNQFAKIHENRHDEDCLTRTSFLALNGAGAGVLAGILRAAWYPDPYVIDSKGRLREYKLGIRHLLRVSAKPVALCALTSGIYAGVECVVEQLHDETREKTYINSAVAGAVAGFAAAGVTRRFDIMAVTALGLGSTLGILEYNMHQNALYYENKHKVKETTGTSVKALKEKYPEYKDL